MFLSDCPSDRSQIIVVDLTILKDIGCDDHMGCSHIKKPSGILGIDSAADLQPSRIFRKRQLCLMAVRFVVPAPRRIQ